MNKRMSLALACLALPSAATAQVPGAPCSTSNCLSEGSAALRLQGAWSAPQTTDTQRRMMAAKIATHTSSGITDWKTASDDYFRWRWVDAGNSAETFPGEGGRPAPIAPAPNFGEWRHNAETALRQRLIDPSSAQFTWPFGFVNGYWKPLLQKRITGWVTCGQVNAKNRMGGFTGSTTFVVVINDGRTTFTDMDSGTNRYGLVAAGCEKFSASLPEPQPGMLEDTSMPASAQGRSSIADELTKLAALRDRGILTESEFQSQKATLLSK